MIDFLEEGSVHIEKAYIHPIWMDINMHPVVNGISMVYIYDIIKEKESVINIANVDFHTTSLDKFDFDITESYIFDKKSLQNVLKLPNSFDTDIIKYLQKNVPLNEVNTPTHTLFQRRFPTLIGINNIIPILKHIESIRKIRNEFLSYLDDSSEFTAGVEKFENFYIESLAQLESNGIWTTSGMEYTQYNPFTITSRPSNTFGGTNYAAIKKDDGSRDRFISRFDGGKLVQMDYDAYHPRIIGKLVDCEIPKNIAGHQYLADLYGVPLEDSKNITFRQLYGGVENDYMGIPYFYKTSKFIDLLWLNFEKDGYITTPMGRKLHKNNLKDINCNKLFNYLLQATETEFNMVILSKIHKVMKNMKSKVVLYTYDSYLFDIHPDEFNVLKDLKILIEENDFPTKVEIGDTYSTLQLVDVKDLI